jgi:hypothetical protein
MYSILIYICTGIGIYKNQFLKKKQFVNNLKILQTDYRFGHVSDLPAL